MTSESVKLAKLKAKSEFRQDMIKLSDNATKLGIALLCNPAVTVLGGYILAETASDTVRKVKDTTKIDTDGSVTGIPGQVYTQRMEYTYLSKAGASDVKSILVGTAFLGSLGSLGAGLISAITGGK